MSEVEPVFVIAPGPSVHFFRDSAELFNDLRRMEPDERKRARFYALSGEKFELLETGRRFALCATGLDDLPTLTDALRSVAASDDAELEPRVVATLVLLNQWKDRWPRRPEWAHRLIHGSVPPVV